MRLWDPVKGAALGPAEVLAKFGVPPDRVADVQARRPPPPLPPIPPPCPRARLQKLRPLAPPPPPQPPPLPWR